MSSPIHQSEDLDPALRYAPPWARDRTSLAGRPHPPPARRPLPGARPEFSGDRAMMDLQRQLLLDPDAIPEPAVDDARTLKPIVLRLAGVMGLAALIAWGVVSLPAIKNVAEIVPLDVKTQAMASDRFTPLQAPTREAASQLSEPQAAANSVPQSSQSNTAMNDAPRPAASLKPLVASLAPVPVVMPPPSGSAMPATMPSPPAAPAVSPNATTAPADAATPPIDETEIAAMIKRGKALLTSGDIVSARLLLRRAADAGNAEAALALGATFDPLVIRQLGAVGMTPDPAQAKQWYRRAATLGSASAMGQLANLEQAQ